MRRIIIGISVAVLVPVSGFAKTLTTADHVTDSDVALESAVKEVRSVPADTGAVIGDTVKFVRDETVSTVDGVKAAGDEFRKDGKKAHAKAKKEGLQEIDKAWDSSKDILFRSYKVSAGVGDLLQAYAADKSASAIDVGDFFKGVVFPPRTSARYLPEFKSLFVHQTMANLLTIEDVLARYQREQKKLFGRQVEIEAKFIEVNESTLNELGFEWTFDNKNGGDLRVFDNFYMPAGQDILSDGLRSASAALGGAPAAGLLDVAKTTGSLHWSLAISALEQQDDSDVLSAPRVVTHSHETAVIQVGEEQMIPKSFEIDNQNTSPYVQHGDWELELMGVQMEVTPEIRHDGLIDLELNTKVLNIIGFDPYQIVPAYAAPVLTGQHADAVYADMNAVNASLPYLRIRKLETRVTVADGSTIGMGGLIYDKLETYRDKVPVLGSIPYLGRLFRSEGERSVKRNLMIFVSATQVDVNGRRSADVVQQK